MWWASRLVGMLSSARSSEGEASPNVRVSMISRRAGSASAAWTAARRSRSLRSVFIESILTDQAGEFKMFGVSTAEVVPAVSLWRRLLAEFLGTGLLVTIVVGSGIAAQQLSPHDVGLQLLENSTATAFGLTVLILMFGPVSGAHFNPVVSLADWFLRRRMGGLTLREVGAYVLVQVVGGIGGSLLANAMFSVGLQLSDKHRASSGHLLGEVVATFGLLVLIFALVRTERAGAVAPAVGAYIGAAYWFTSSTSFANPAVTIGRIFSDTFAGIAPASAGPFVVAQLLGTVVAIPMIQLLFPIRHGQPGHHQATHDGIDFGAERRGSGDLTGDNQPRPGALVRGA